MKAAHAIGIDLGGTNIKAGVVDADGRILHRHEQPTLASRGPAPVIDAMCELVTHLRRQAEVAAIGLGTPGPLHLEKGCIIHAANLPGWKDVPIRDALHEKTGLPVVLENDGNAAAFGEYTAGAGMGCRHMVMLTLGTGVGAGAIIDGAILHGHFDNAAELGHMIVVPDGEPCPCGQRGCLERYASADAVVRRADQNRDGHGAVPRTAADVAAAAERGDPACRRVWDEACRYLAIACVNIQHAYNPQRVIFGGGMSQAGAFLIDGVRAGMAERTWKLHQDTPEIALAELGNDAGIVGTAALARRSVQR